MDLGLSGKAAIVTGGSRGIGRAVCRRLMAEGAQVLAVARDAAVLEDAARDIGEGLRTFPYDVTRRDAGERIRVAAHEHFGRVDVLVNNAGRSCRSPFMELDDDVWFEDFDLKVVAAGRVTRALLPALQERGAGRIVNLASYLGKNPVAGSMPTAASRAAGLAFTKVLAGEFARAGVTVNAVSVGFVRSHQIEQRALARGGPDGIERYYEELAAEEGIPMGRVGLAEEVASVVAFLASEAASYVTGTAVQVDGGLSHAI